jgi:hypothetical protein
MQLINSTTSRQYAVSPPSDVTAIDLACEVEQRHDACRAHLMLAWFHSWARAAACRQGLGVTLTEKAKNGRGRVRDAVRARPPANGGATPHQETVRCGSFKPLLVR